MISASSLVLRAEYDGQASHVTNAKFPMNLTLGFRSKTPLPLMPLPRWALLMWNPEASTAGSRRTGSCGATCRCREGELL